MIFTGSGQKGEAAKGCATCDNTCYVYTCSTCYNTCYSHGCCTCNATCHSIYDVKAGCNVCNQTCYSYGCCTCNNACHATLSCVTCNATKY